MGERGRAGEVGLNRAHVSLLGELTHEAATNFLDQLREAPTNEPVVIVEVTTPGGLADLARRIVLEIDIARDRFQRLVFVGKTQVYSAGVTIMSAFPKGDRYLERSCSLLIHCRQLDKEVTIEGSMRSSLPKVEALAKQLRTGLEIEEETFERLIAGSDVDLDELQEKALSNWYLTAEEAHRRGLVAALLEPAGEGGGR